MLRKKQKKPVIVNPNCKKQYLYAFAKKLRKAFVFFAAFFAKI